MFPRSSSRAGNIVGASNILRDITERKAAEKQISTLSQEIAHRTKNLLSVVQAIVRQTSSVGDRDTLVQRLMERLSAFAATHELVVASDWAAVDLGALVQSQLGHFKDLFGSRINIQGRPLQINAAAAQNIGMAIHELATNASKYGALSRNGKVEIDWGFRRRGRRLSLGMAGKRRAACKNADAPGIRRHDYSPRRLQRERRIKHQIRPRRDHLDACCAAGERTSAIALGSPLSPSASMMPEQRKEYDNGNWDAQEPKENAATETHGTLRGLFERSVDLCSQTSGNNQSSKSLQSAGHETTK